MRRIESEDELRELHARGLGFIYNDYAGTGAGGSRYNVLHAASCPWILRSRASIPKYYAASRAEAERWLEAHRGREDVGWKRCGTCHARPAPAARGSQTTRERRAAPAIPSPSRKPQSPSGGPYLVQTKEAAAGAVVAAWSADRLPYEPRGWLAAFRDELRVALRRLEAAPHELLYALYASAQEDFFDVENILFYNVGTPSLARAGRYGVCYERAYHVPAPPHPVSWPARHYHGYRLQPASPGFVHWQEGPVLARWQFTTGERADLTDCTRLWFRLKTTGHIEALRAAPRQPFILRVLITAPPAAPLVATNLLKPLSDGVVCAFHGHNGQDEVEICRRLAARLQTEPGAVHTFLNDEATAVLGTRRLLWPYRNGVQWNPADDLCVAAELRVRPAAGHKAYLVQGELLAAEYAGDTR
jgi:hypothetical protein